MKFAVLLIGGLLAAIGAAGWWFVGVGFLFGMLSPIAVAGGILWAWNQMQKADERLMQDDWP